MKLLFFILLINCSVKPAEDFSSNIEIQIQIDGKNSREKASNIKTYLKDNFLDLKNELTYKNGVYTMRLKAIKNGFETKNIVSYIHRFNTDYLIFGFNELEVIESSDSLNKGNWKETISSIHDDRLSISSSVKSDSYITKILNFKNNQQYSSVVKILESSGLNYVLK